jgi:phosphomannomutase/phosphoglucomutase
MYDTINNSGGRAIMWKTGHGFIKSKMKEEKAVLAGEMSGHIFFKDRYYGFDDAVYAGCRFIEIVAKHKRKDPDFKISDFIDSLPWASASKEVRYKCPNEFKMPILDELTELFDKDKNLFANPIRDIITIDGLRLVFPDGFALIRASNTEPVFTMRFEAQTEENSKNYKETMLNLVDKMLDNLQTHKV